LSTTYTVEGHCPSEWWIDKIETMLKDVDDKAE
jgi:hypothetical protein